MKGREIRRSASLLLTVPFALMLCGCLPRGESKSVDQLLVTSRQRFGAVQPVVDKLQDESREKVESIVAGLRVLQSKDELSRHAAAAGAIEESLLWLVKRAGYTSRPSFGEIAGQFRVLAADLRRGLDASGDEHESASLYPASPEMRVKLLAARTYSLLASELETTAFKA